MDALLQAGDNICNTLAKISPATDKTRRAINFLMDVFKVQANKNESSTNTQRVGMEEARAQRMIEGEADQTIGAKSEEMVMDNNDLRTTKEIEVYYPSKDATTNNVAPESISKDESNPSRNTKTSKRKNILSAKNVSVSCPTAAQSASISYPLKFLADFAGAVLDNETGELLEYCYLIKLPK